MHLKYNNLTFLYKPAGVLQLPEFTGSTFRGVFGHALKQISCVDARQDCSSCTVAELCLYRLIFETTIPDPSDAPIPGLNQLPHPYIIQPNSNINQQNRSNGLLAVRLTLFGPVINWITSIFQVMVRFGEIGVGKGRTKLDLIQIEDSYSGDIIFAKDGGWQTIPQVYRLGLVEQALGSKIILEISTAMLLSKHDQDERGFKADALVRSILRRFQTMAFYYGSNFKKVDMNLLREDLKALSYRSDLHFQKRYRYSNRHKSEIPMGGFEGSLEVSNVSPFIRSILKIGETINVGKGAAMGLGQYRIRATE